MTLQELILETFGEDTEVAQVAMYIVSTLTINDAVIRGNMTNAKEVTGVPPEALLLVRRFDNDMMKNGFFIENFAPIKAQVALDDIRIRSASYLVAYAKEKGETRYYEQAKSVLMTRLDSFTLLAFLWKGAEFAEDFDIKLRSTGVLSPEHQRFFDEVM